MYDYVVVGQGFTGLLSAIWATEHAEKVALVAKGTGKILQSSGVMELYPKLVEREKSISKIKLEEAIFKFKGLVKQLGYPYHGNASKMIPIVTGAGFVKETNLYPETVKPLPEKGRVIIVGFHEIIDFQPEYVKGNLQKERPELEIDTIMVRLGKGSLRTMTQLDGARVLDFQEVRTNVIAEIINQMKSQGLDKPNLFIFPAALGMKNWKAVISDFRTKLGSEITEAPGMPPNATAIRLHEVLLKEAVKRGVRFYMDTEVIGSHVEDRLLTKLVIKNNTKTMDVRARQYIVAGGGVLGGGFEVTEKGLKDRTLHLDVDDHGRYIYCPENVFPVGAQQGINVTQHGITGGLYSILSSYESFIRFEERGMKHA
ncbi:FAD-binding protein [Robertmurraya andreesenii]|uniref:Glycerol-3-phosphate dehydrogenase subunit B n=1 Tax=Anoxybacillus andreesenii TaxID=1325932 RepID=A0ABT9V0P9_9BACL|nr:FAD-binding protein [Robertmurraya andreesenii]MDQ0154488.1 glycerol-3-phosphate dehydrogenase subunit B [Robertmurraya andreesenii]